MTTDADLDEPAYRSEHDPIERLMDEIAGHEGHEPGGRSGGPGKYFQQLFKRDYKPENVHTLSFWMKEVWKRWTKRFILQPPFVGGQGRGR
jgi:hypothetical protein